MLKSAAKWIWIGKDASPEEYACFKDSFFYRGGRVVLRIAAETDYIATVNGKTVGFGQFPGYPFEKYYDELDITEACMEGENGLSLTVRYEGMEKTATHIVDGAGVIYEVKADKDVVAFSRAGLPCGLDGRYLQHRVRKITVQLGLSSGMCVGTPAYDMAAVEVEKTDRILPRPVKKTELAVRAEAKPLGGGIYDLGCETAGYLFLKVRAKEAQEFKIAYGEHLTDGCVRRRIGSRDFSLDFAVTGGEHTFVQYFVRVACRYLQLLSDGDVEIEQIGVEHYLYPLTEVEHPLTGLDQRIYDTCVRTLRLSMNHHYEDCPWREQALYVLDSRNQMLCGYYAFKEREYQRANLVFMSKGAREDGFLELTFPAINTPSIPFFSIMYAVAVFEYIQHTGDETILSEVFPRIRTIMEGAAARLDGKHLLRDFEEPYWNFYEWSEGSEGYDKGYKELPAEQKCHLILNCAFVYAGERYKSLCRTVGVDCNIDFDAVRGAIVETFFDAACGLFVNTRYHNRYSQLGNAMALLIGLGDVRTANALKENGDLIPVTLSMAGYVYDALLGADFEENREFVLEDIRKKYGYMLERGATSFWETIDGDAAFGGAGSLCHGWSAMPIYYYNICK